MVRVVVSRDGNMASLFFVEGSFHPLVVHGSI